MSARGRAIRKQEREERKLRRQQGNAELSVSKKPQTEQLESEPKSVIAELFGEGGDPKNGDIRIARRAIRNDWGIDPETRQLVIGKMASIIKGESPNGRPVRLREMISAGRTIIAADSLHARREQSDIDAAKSNLGVKTDVNLNVEVNISQQVQQAMASEPAYLEWIREQRLRECGHADALGDSSIAAEILDASAHSGDGQGGN